MPRSPLPLRFRGAETPLDGETLFLEESGPWVVVLTTTLPTLPLALNSIYLGHDRSEQALVAELVDAGEGAEAPDLVKRRIALELAAFTYERRSFLYDHLGRLQDLAFERHGVALRIEGSERAARALDPLAAGR